MIHQKRIKPYIYAVYANDDRLWYINIGIALREIHYFEKPQIMCHRSKKWQNKSF